MTIEQRMVQVLTQKLGFYEPVEAIGYETLWLHKDEIDERLVPSYLMKQLEETVIFSSASYEAEDGTYYLLMQLLLPNDEIHEIWLVDDVVIVDFAEQGDEEA